VSDTTRGVHLLAEAVEAGAGDPRLDATFPAPLRQEHAGALLDRGLGSWSGTARMPR